jgi:hypothetical protein
MPDQRKPSETDHAPVTRTAHQSDKDAEPDNPADNPDHPVQPAGQATSPASDADAKEHQRTGEPGVDPNESGDDASDTQRIALTLPRSTVDRIRAHADANGMNQSDAAADLLKAPAGGGPGFHQNY